MVAFKINEYFQVWLYFMLFNASIFSLTISSHEIGHLYVGYLNGCTGRIILFDMKGSQTYTEIQCKEHISNITTALGSYLFVIPLSLLFLLLNTPEKNFFYVIFGLGLSTSSLDIFGLINSDLVFYGLLTLGTLLVIYGEVLLVNSYIFASENVSVKL